MSQTNKESLLESLTSGSNTGNDYPGNGMAPVSLIIDAQLIPVGNTASESLFPPDDFEEPNGQSSDSPGISQTFLGNSLEVDSSLPHAFDTTSGGLSPPVAALIPSHENTSADLESTAIPSRTPVSMTGDQLSSSPRPIIVQDQGSRISPGSKCTTLEQSGLLTANAPGLVVAPKGGGLFDDVDEEERLRENNKQRKLQTEQLKLAEEEKLQRELQQEKLEIERHPQLKIPSQLHQDLERMNIHDTNQFHSASLYAAAEHLTSPPLIPESQWSSYADQPSQTPSSSVIAHTQVPNTYRHFQQFHPSSGAHAFGRNAPQSAVSIDQQSQHQNLSYGSTQQTTPGFYRDVLPGQEYPQRTSAVVPSNVYSGQQGYNGLRPTGDAGAPFSGVAPQPHAGMYNGNPQLGVVPSPTRKARQQLQPTLPPSLPVGRVLVSEPLLISASGSSLFGIRQPPHWSYQIQTQFESGSTWLVRRRFRHVVALEERLRQECPGAIFPPRPEKHASRALEEATAHQSADFAMQRALELQSYLNALMQHPYACRANSLRLFLSLQDDLGTAWAEVSSNALTRLANVSVGAAMSLSETTTRGMGVFSQDDLPEDSADLLALQAAEATRMGAVLQAVPKLEGCVTLLKDHAEQVGTVGMELQKAKAIDDMQPFEILAHGMLRSSRRSKREVAELLELMQTFSYHYKLVRYEKLAFGDRKHALAHRAKERGKADQRAAQLMLQQRQVSGFSSYGGGVDHLALDRLEREAAVSDELATEATMECEEIGRRIQLEVARTSLERRAEWCDSLKLVAQALKSAASERLSMWILVQEQFSQAYQDHRD